MFLTASEFKHLIKDITVIGMKHIFFSKYKIRYIFEINHCLFSAEIVIAFLRFAVMLCSNITCI